jgi:demethylmenaquinone methyltransferase/2-methoxy-6-polyprenyl-1,4-benzoquinol methylase
MTAEDAVRSSARSRGEAVREMFARIAPCYDLLNHVLSMGVDVLWRRTAAAALDVAGACSILDVACGTGDLTRELARHAAPGSRVIGVDFCGPMVSRAAAKLGRAASGAVSPRLRVVHGDGLALPFAGGAFDRASIAFGIRNMADLDAALAELARVLAPGGRLAILEFSRPRSPFFRRLYYAYFLNVLPLVGRLVSGESDPYRYLPDSVLAFPEREELAVRIGRAGFAEVSVSDLTFGIATLYVARRAASAA